MFRRIQNIIRRLNLHNGRLGDLEAKPDVTLGYTEYVGLISQDGSFDPVLTKIKNDLGAITISRSEQGVYFIDSIGLFITNKTIVLQTPGVDYPAPGWIFMYDLINENRIGIYSFDPGTIGVEDNLIFDSTLIIRVYE